MAGIINRRGVYYAQFRSSERTPEIKRYSLKTHLKAEARKRH